MLYKGSGLKEVMDNNRFIHSKDWIPRLFEDLVVSKMKSKIQQKTTKFQIGGMKGHRSTEHLFSVKSVIAYYSWIDKPLIIQCIDIRKYFDKENLCDAMNAVYSAGVQGRDQQNSRKSLGLDNLCLVSLGLSLDNPKNSQSRGVSVLTT